MAFKLSSLRVTAEMDVTQYARAAAQKVAADQDMVGSGKAVGQSLAAVDAAATKSVPGVAALSRVWITGYGDAAKFESAVRRVGHAMDNGLDASRATALLDGIYRKFGQVADAADLAKQGFVSLAPVISALNDRYDATSAIADRATAATKRLSEAQKAQAEINSRLGVQTDFGGASRAADIVGYGNAIDALRAKYVPLSAAQQQYRAELDEIRTATRAGVLSQAEQAAAIAKTKDAFASQVVAMKGTAQANDNMVRTTGLARHEIVNLSRQLQDVFVSLSSGQSPFTVLIQQGTQVADVFATSQGTVGGFFRQLAAWAAPLAPMLLGVATAAGAMYAALSVSSERQTLNNSLLGSGRASGVTGDQLNAMAKEAASAADITVSSSRMIAAEFARLGQIAQTSLPRLTQVTKDFAAASGQTLPEAAKELRQALADPERGAASLSEKLGTLDQAVVKAARSAGTYNERLAAMKNLLEEVGRAADGAADRSLSKLDRLWENGVKKPLAALGEGAAGLILGKDDTEKAQALRKELAGLRKEIDDASAKKSPIYDDQIVHLRENVKAREQELAVIERSLEPERQRAELSAKIARDNDIAARANAAARPYETLKISVEDASKAYKELNEERERIIDKGANLLGGNQLPTNRQALEQVADLGASYRDIDEKARSAKRYVDDLRKAEEAGGIEAYRSAEAIRIKNKYLGDMSASARVAQAGELALNETFGTQATEAQRNAQANKARNDELFAGTRALAESNSQANDNVRSLQGQTKATVELGKEAGETARIRAEAAKEARETGGNEGDIFARKMREEQERLRLSIAGTNAELKDRVAAQSQANAAAAAGNKSSTERNALEREYAARSADLRALEAKGITDKREQNKLLDEGARLRQQELSAQKNSVATDYLSEQERSLKTGERQLELIRLSRGARLEELEVLRAQEFLWQNGISAESEKGRQILANARALGKQNEQREIELKLQNQIRQAQEFAADAIKSFMDELLTGTDGLNGALKSLGKGFLSASLDALISGKGPLAGITGLASTTKDGQGGALGLLTSGIQDLGKQVEKGAKEGTSGGIALAINSEGQSFLSGGLGIDGKQLAGGLSAIAGLAGAYGVGASAGSYGQAVGGGALSGGVAGLALAGSGIIAGSLGSAAVLGPIGLIIGGALAYTAQKAARDAAKKQREEQAQENYRQAAPGIDTLRSQLRGESQDTLENRIKSTLAEVQKGIDVAFFANKIPEANALGTDFGTYKDKAITDFQIAFNGLVDSMEDGLGPNSAFSQARESVKQTGDVLKGFVSDAAYAFGAEATQVDQAREAARTHALSILDGAKSLSTVATRMEEIRGAGAALQQLLIELGMSASDAAAAIQQDTIAALGRLKDSFETDLKSKINDARGVGYLNDVVNLLKEVSTLRVDAASLGSPQSLVDDYFKAAAQEIVNGANLSGDALANLTAAFPQLAGVVTASAQAIEQAQAELQSKVDQARSALQTAYDREAGALDVTIDRMEQFTASIRKFREELLLDADRSPLSSAERFAEAQRQFRATSALAASGDTDAMGQLQSISQSYLDEAKDYYASSERYYAAFSEVQGVLGRTEIKAQSEIDVARLQLSALDRQVAGLLTVNDSVLSVANAIANLQAAMAAQAAAAVAAVGSQTGAGGGSTGWGDNTAPSSAGAIVVPGVNGATIADWLQWQSDSIGKALSGGMRLGGVVAGYAGGGVVGNGIWNQDSVLARYAGGGSIALAGGEFVMPAPQSAAYMPELQAMRAGRGPSNDNGLSRADIAALGKLIAQEIRAQTLELREELANTKAALAKLEATTRLEGQKMKRTGTGG